MKTYKVEMTLDLNEETNLEWLFQAVRDLLEDGEGIFKARSLDITEEIEE